MKITNPNFNTGIGAIRDPMIISYGGRYYMTGTSPQFWRGENPGVRIFVSDDLSHWEFFTLAVDSAKIASDAPCRILGAGAVYSRRQVLRHLQCNERKGSRRA